MECVLYQNAHRADGAGAEQYAVVFIVLFAVLIAVAGIFTLPDLIRLFGADNLFNRRAQLMPRRL